ncbi:hypothetical protein MSAN_02249100 [Mycena sanguinolenta]|uniref:Ankyrin n=1 Tax=Mycena sanguinolenta TaxID=230812 RepID=A0A8H7CJL1_9AGAR|nr:hypothetical protein MSAN_02249100 [Mycena sanguinolenta]
MFTELPLELVLHTVSFLTRLSGDYHLAKGVLEMQELIPDLPSINALSQTNTVLYSMLNETLYELCASVQPLGAAALLFAVAYELGSTLDKCVAAGISLDNEFIFGRPHSRCSLLYVAAAMGARAMVVKLLEMYGEGMMARVHALGSSLDGTPLDCAARNEHMEIVRLLAPIPMPSPDVFLKISPSISVQLESQGQYLGRALIEAIGTSNLEISRYLVSEGADVNVYQNFNTPLNKAISSKNLELVQFLLASGADPNRSDGGFSPLFNAADDGSVELIEALLAAGANPHTRDSDSRNVFAVIRDIELWRLFLELRVDPNHQDGFGSTALHYACFLPTETAKACIELLLQFGAATIQEADHEGFTPVDIAMQDNNPEIVKMLEPLVHDPELQMKIGTWWKEREAADSDMS